MSALASSWQLLPGIVLLHHVVGVHWWQARVVDDVNCLWATHRSVDSLSLTLERVLLHGERLLLERVAFDRDTTSAHDTLTVQHVLIGQV